MIFAIEDAVSHSDAASMIGFYILFIISFVLYWIPTAVAITRKHPQWVAILILNLFAGWTIIGWVAAIVWAFIVPEKAQA